ncbi:MAG: Arm DNA-binding domain-containing protein [Rhodospirillaceae bacterium]|nr:Arm DNA-binding domain-containing protein [Rhodospirillaceae bacterium]
MAMQQKTLSNRTAAALTVERDTVFWDRGLTGFGVRVYPSGGKVYIVQARGPEGPKRITVGRNDVLNADQARQRAALIIARIKAGEEPVPLPLAARLNGGPTVGDLAERYLEEHVAVRLKPETRRRIRGMIVTHIILHKNERLV